MLETFYIIAFFYINAKKGCYTAFLILWKESLNSDGQQFHQYQQNDQSPLTEHKKKLLTTYDVGNPGSGLGQAYRYDGFKPVNGIPTNLGKKRDCTVRGWSYIAFWKQNINIFPIYFILNEPQ